MANTNILDISVLEALKPLEEATPGIIKEIIDIFINTMPAELQALRKAQQKQSAVDLASAAHHFKSSCLNVGAHSMVDMLKRLELQAAQLSPQNVEDILKSLEDQAEVVIKELQAIRGQV